MATDASTMDLDSRRNCVTCKTRMSSFLHDSHKICSVCRGFDCSLDKRCSECEAWSEQVMTKYVKYRKSLDSKSKAKKEKKTSSSDQASLSSSRDSNVSLSSAASAGVSEARVTELISSQLGHFSASFAASMQASFDNIRSFIDERFASQDVQPESNPSPVPVYLGPRQTQTDPSVRSPCVDFGSGGEAQEPVQADSATSSFLASLQAAGIVVSQGVVMGDRVDRAPSPATVHGAPAVAAQHEQPQEPLGGGRTALAASAHPAPAVAVQGGQAQSILRSDRASSSQAGFAGPSLGTSPPRSCLS